MRVVEKATPCVPYRSDWPREFSLEAMTGNVQRMGTVTFAMAANFSAPSDNASSASTSIAEQADETLRSSCNLEFLGLRRARIERPGGPAEPERSGDRRSQISRGWSAAEPPDKPTHTFKPRQGRQKSPTLFRFSHICRPCRGSHGLLDGFRGFRSFLALPPANFYGPSRGRSHVRTKANPIGVAAYALQSKLPGELKGKLPTAKQLADIVRAEMEAGK